MSKWKLPVFACFAMSLFVFGCSKPSDLPDTGSTSGALQTAHLYPHTAAFKTDRSHGDAFLQDKLQCAKCHGTDLHGGTQAKRSCNECHKAYPHTMDWASPQRHGLQYLMANEEGRQQCRDCHSPGRPAGAVSCQGCHSVFPHGDDWMNPENHGEASKEPGAQCLTCHNMVTHDAPDFVEANTMRCKDCHGDNVPHQIGWADPKRHGVTFAKLSDADRKNCMGCHFASTDKKKNPNIACKDCHKAFPHSKDFMDGADDHPDLAKTFEGKCTACHRDFKDNMPKTDGKGCVFCHEKDTYGDFVTGWSKMSCPAGTAGAQSFHKTSAEHWRAFFSKHKDRYPTSSSGLKR